MVAPRFSLGFRMLDGPVDFRSAIVLSKISDGQDELFGKRPEGYRTVAVRAANHLAGV